MTDAKVDVSKLRVSFLSLVWTNTLVDYLIDLLLEILWSVMQEVLTLSTQDIALVHLEKRCLNFFLFNLLTSQWIELLFRLRQMRETVLLIWNRLTLFDDLHLRLLLLAWVIITDLITNLELISAMSDDLALTFQLLIDILLNERRINFVISSMQIDESWLWWL